MTVTSGCGRGVKCTGLVLWCFLLSRVWAQVLVLTWCVTDGRSSMMHLSSGVFDHQIVWAWVPVLSVLLPNSQTHWHFLISKVRCPHLVTGYGCAAKHSELNRFFFFWSAPMSAQCGGGDPCRISSTKCWLLTIMFKIFNSDLQSSHKYSLAVSPTVLDDLFQGRYLATPTSSRLTVWRLRSTPRESIHWLRPRHSRRPSLNFRVVLSRSSIMTVSTFKMALILKSPFVFRALFHGAA